MEESPFESYMRFHGDDLCEHKKPLKKCEPCKSIQAISLTLAGLIGACVVHNANRN